MYPLGFCLEHLKDLCSLSAVFRGPDKIIRGYFLQVFTRWATSVLTNGAPGAISAPASVLPGLCTYKGTVLSGRLPLPHSSVLSGLGHPSPLLEAAAGCGHSRCWATSAVLQDSMGIRGRSWRCGEGLANKLEPLHMVAMHSSTELHPNSMNQASRDGGQTPLSSLSQFLSPEWYLGLCSEKGVFSNTEGPGEGIIRAECKGPS